MGYCVRLLTLSENIVPFRDIQEQVNTIRQVSETESAWDKVEIRQADESPIALLERYPLVSEGRGQKEMDLVKEALHGSYPLNARRWLENYLSAVRVVYCFRLQAENITGNSWPLLGRIQNLLKDRLGGIIQADEEGFYNEAGDYILWKMYEGATGSIPAAVLNENGEWVSYQLKLYDDQAVEQFKQGITPPRGFLDRLWGR